MNPRTNEMQGLTIRAAGMRRRWVVGLSVALAVVIAACGDGNGSGTSDSGAGPMVVARSFVDAIEAGDLDGAMAMVAEDITIDCYGEERFVGRTAVGDNLCWPGDGEAVEFTDGSGAGVVSWKVFGSRGAQRWENVMDAQISDGVITSLVLTYHQLETADARDDSLPTVQWGADLEVGQTYRYDLYIHCGMDFLGEFNGSLFGLVDPPRGATPKSSWPMVPDEILGLVTLVDGDTIEYSIPSGEVIATYRTTDEEAPACA